MIDKSAPLPDDSFANLQGNEVVMGHKVSVDGGVGNVRLLLGPYLPSKGNLRTPGIQR